MTRRPPANLLFHSDRGVQYASREYRKALGAAGLLAFMSRKGNCYDNATMESFRSTLKLELVYRRVSTHPHIHGHPLIGRTAPKNPSLQRGSGWPNLVRVKTPEKAHRVVDGHCAGPATCPLSRVQAGTIVCIKQLSTAPEVSARLRELGFCEEQRIKLVSKESSFICQVCNARFGISEALADSILVQAVPDAPALA